ncbi:hypothetical protein EVB37_082 [Rhizobium phage RHph_TM3_3_3]|nr:hypothetical protein EVB37_082 [Rhizobium phage RHph_TM3_3_3]
MITREDIIKAFDEKVEFRLAPWSVKTGLRQPTASEVRERLLKLLSADQGPSA